jgi:tRNA nucleotidyltransferase (CCA-adding enzyme)
MARLDSLGLLFSINPFLTWDEWLADHIAILGAIDPQSEWELSGENALIKRELAYVIWMIRLPVEHAMKAINRLKLSTNLSKTIVSACVLWQDQGELAGAPPSVFVTCLEEIPPLSRYAFYLAVSDAELRDKLLSYITRWKNIQPTIDGAKLKSLGLPPGPIYKSILGCLRDAWLDGKINTPEDEQKMLAKLLRSEKASSH